MSDLSYAKGTDISQWNKDIDWTVMASKVNFVMIRVAIGSVVDTHFHQNINGAIKNNIPFGVYYVPIPSLPPVSFNFNMVSRFIQGGHNQFPLWLDFEIGSGVGQWARDWVNGFAQHTGREVGVYTSPSWWNSNSIHNGQTLPKLDCPLWIANWSRIRTEPILPIGWDTWQIWQYSADGNGLGKEYGSNGDADMDLNYYNLPVSQFKEKFQPNSPAPAKHIFKSDVPGLRIRTSPTVNSRVVGALGKGELIVQDDLEIWVKHRRGWSAVRHDGINYMIEVEF